jgi:branched-chain amino acid transport system substrate-binding protein
MRGNRILFVAVALLTVIGLISAPALAAEPIKIGAAFALQGPWGDYCKRNVIALDMAVEKINAAGGVNGVPLKSVLYDTASKPDEATRIVRKLASDDNVLAILGPFSSSEAEVAYPVGNKIGIVMIAQASSKPGVAAASRPYALRNKIDELRLAMPAMKKWKEAYNIKSVAIVHDAKDAVGRSLGTQVLPGVCKKMGLQIVNEESPVTFQTGDFDMRPQVTKLKSLNFDGIVFGGNYQDGVTFIKEARRQDVKQPMVAGNPLTHINFPVQGGTAAEGVFCSAEFYYWMDKPSVQAFTKEFTEKAKAKGYEPPQPQQFDVNVYDSVFMLARVMKEKGITNKPADLAEDRKKIMEGLVAMKGFQGLASKIEFNEDGDAVKDVYVVKAHNGQWVLVD